MLTVRAAVTTRSRVTRKSVESTVDFLVGYAITRYFEAITPSSRRESAYNAYRDAYTIALFVLNAEIPPPSEFMAWLDALDELHGASATRRAS